MAIGKGLNSTYQNELNLFLGLLGVAFAPNFWIALVAIVFAGCSATFGEKYVIQPDTHTCTIILIV